MPSKWILREGKKMNPEIKAKWVAALRSGQYQQGKGYLKRWDADDLTPSHCCLGVLCEIAKAEGVDVSESKLDSAAAGMSAYAMFGKDSQTLPDVVQRWAGLGSTNPYIPYDHEDRNMWTLAELNDGGDNHDAEEHTFNDIADLIEEHL